jgi:hypothetical protein
MPTVDEHEVLQRMEQLTELIRTRFDALAVSVPVTMRPGDVVYEVQALAAEIEDKERQLRRLVSRNYICLSAHNWLKSKSEKPY